MCFFYNLSLILCFIYFTFNLSFVKALNHQNETQNNFFEKENEKKPNQLKNSINKPLINHFAFNLRNQISLEKQVKHTNLNNQKDQESQIYIVQFNEYSSQNELFKRFKKEVLEIEYNFDLNFNKTTLCQLEDISLKLRESFILQKYPITDFITLEVKNGCLDKFSQTKNTQDSFQNLDFLKNKSNSTNEIFVKRIFLDQIINISPKYKRTSMTEDSSSSLSDDPIKELNVEDFWKKGFTGKGVHVGIFDTGISNVVKGKNYFEDIVETVVYTENENAAHDDIGHGTFVASVIAAKPEKNCKGIAPGSSLHIFKVFTKNQASYTSWFLDAFNYMLQAKVNILNLSIGGPDYMDQPFIDKVLELTANGVIFISAIGNDGPLFGTLNNPGDMPSVIGVGGLDSKRNVASFSSRGVTTQYLRKGYGRVKPDLLSFGQNVPGLHSRGGCQKLSGTSVSSPVVTGVVALLASVVPEELRFQLLNPGSMKQILQEGSDRLADASIYEQGAGNLNLMKSYDALLKYRPKITFFPNNLDLTDCPYLWPHCSQPLYASSMPLILNVTILNGISLTAKITECHFISDGPSVLNVGISYDETVWPYSGWLALQISVKRNQFFEGTTSGVIKCGFQVPPSTTIPSSDGSIDSDPIGLLSNIPQIVNVDLPLSVRVIRTPPRERRILWDQYHSIQYPPGYLPRDDLNIRDEILDWNGDHLHTNFRDFYNYLRKNNYYIEILNGDLTSFNPSNYASLMIVDSEEEFSKAERKALLSAVKDEGLGLIVLADWYNKEIMEKIIFFDENTKSKWIPVTGGSNLPALNGLLEPFGIAFGEKVYEGYFSFGNGFDGKYSSGTSIVRFPTKSLIGFASLKNQVESFVNNRNSIEKKVPIFGLSTFGLGRIAVFGDSNCIDSSHRSKKDFCFTFMDGILHFINKIIDSPHQEMRNAMTYIDTQHEFIASNHKLPEPIYNLIDQFSYVLKEDRVYAKPLNVTHIWESEIQIDQPKRKPINKLEGPAVIFIPVIILLFIIVTVIYISYSQSKSTIYVMNPEIEMVKQV